MLVILCYFIRIVTEVVIAIVILFPFVYFIASSIFVYFSANFSMISYALLVITVPVTDDLTVKSKVGSLNVKYSYIIYIRI